jgi:hypothetical protein
MIRRHSSRMIRRHRHHRRLDDVRLVWNARRCCQQINLGCTPSAVLRQVIYSRQLTCPARPATLQGLRPGLHGSLQPLLKFLGPPLMKGWRKVQRSLLRLPSQRTLLRPHQRSLPRGQRWLRSHQGNLRWMAGTLPGGQCTLPSGRHSLSNSSQRH